MERDETFLTWSLYILFTQWLGYLLVTAHWTCGSYGWITCIQGKLSQFELLYPNPNLQSILSVHSGWGTCWSQLIELVDPTGESHAYKVKYRSSSCYALTPTCNLYILFTQWLGYMLVTAHWTCWSTGESHAYKVKYHSPHSPCPHLRWKACYTKPLYIQSTQ